MASKTGKQDLVAGFLEGMTATIDRKVKEKEREAKLKDDLTLYKEKLKLSTEAKDQASATKYQNDLDLAQVKIEGDVLKHKLTKAYDMKLQKDWMKELQGQQPQDFTKETGNAVTGQATVNGQQVPYAQTVETPTGREPQKELGVDYGGLAGAQQPYMTSSGVGIKGASDKDKKLILISTIEKIGSVQPLNAVQKSLLKGLKDSLKNKETSKASDSDTDFLKSIGINTENETEDISPEQEEIIQSNMDYYGKSREEVIAALKSVGKL